MTRHGGSRSLKRLNTPKFLQIRRKHGKFFVTPSAGPHPSRFCLPLLHIVRDLLEIVDNSREAKKLIGLGNFKVDGKVVRDKTFPVGLMDVISILKTNEHYRILPDSHHGLILHEIPEAESTFKLCRITQKTTLKGGNLQLNLHDGRNIFISVKDPMNPKEDVYKRMDVLKITIPEQEILKVLKFKEGNLAIIMSGKNIGQLGKVLTILKRFGPKASTVSIQHNSSHTATLYDYTFIIGEDQSEINLPTSE
ncbi:MAG: 30S ribosomal protein S4e [Candidatus Lokiarchaeota archaeon]|nr:30S ribosomal protein S4e [Candidatus Lokiarchaeota archaeon]